MEVVSVRVHVLVCVHVRMSMSSCVHMSMEFKGQYHLPESSSALHCLSLNLSAH